MIAKIVCLLRPSHSGTVPSLAHVCVFTCMCVCVCSTPFVLTSCTSQSV